MCFKKLKRLSKFLRNTHDELTNYNFVDDFIVFCKSDGWQFYCQNTQVYYFLFQGYYHFSKYAIFFIVKPHDAQLL